MLQHLRSVTAAGAVEVSLLFGLVAGMVYAALVSLPAWLVYACLRLCRRAARQVPLCAVRPAGTRIKPAVSAVESGLRFRPGRVDRDDLIETAHTEHLPHNVRQGAQRERGVPLPEALGGHEDGAKACAADVDELLEVQDHRAVAIFDRGSDRLLELPDVPGINSPGHADGQDAVLPFGGQVHGLRLPKSTQHTIPSVRKAAQIRR